MLECLIGYIVSQSLIGKVKRRTIADSYSNLLL